MWLFIPHFMLFLFPPLMLTLATGALWLLTWRVPGSLLGRGLFAALLGSWLWVQLVGLQLYYRYPPHGNDGLRELAAQLGQAAPGDPVLVTPPALEVTLRQYYSGPIHGLPSDFDLRAIYLPYEPARWNRESLAALDAQASGHPRFWLVYLPPDKNDQGAFLRAVRARYHQDLSRTYKYATLYRFSAR
jgi:hypothetical protein